MQSEFVWQDNDLRLPRYRRDEEVEAWLLNLNTRLQEAEVYEPSGDAFPTIFVLGLPRSGVTVSHQLICYCLDVGYIDNVIARFWLAPLHGLMLSSSVLAGGRDGSFVSDYGKSVDVRGPHEFHYFWQHWLKIRSDQDLMKFGVPRPEVEWDRLGRVVKTMQDLWQRGIAFEGRYAPFDTVQFAQTFSMPLFVYLVRDPLDVALSLLKTRHAYFGDYDTWVAMIPENYSDLKKLPYYEQIAGQVVGLDRTYKRELDRLEGGIVVTVDYEEMCQSPGMFLQTITDRLQSLYGFKVDLLNDPPDRFDIQRYSRTLTPDQQLVASALSRRMAEKA